MQVGGNVRIGPALGVQIDNGSTPLVGVSDLGVGWIAPRGHAGWRSSGQGPFDGMVRGLAPKTDKANARNLMWAKGRVLRFQIDDQLTHVFREPLPRIRSY